MSHIGLKQYFRFIRIIDYIKDLAKITPKVKENIELCRSMSSQIANTTRNSNFINFVSY